MFTPGVAEDVGVGQPLRRTPASLFSERFLPLVLCAVAGLGLLPRTRDPLAPQGMRATFGAA